MKLTRKKEREIIVLALYNYEITQNPIDKVIDDCLALFKLDEVSDYIKDNVTNVIKHQEELDQIISENLINYKLDRLSYLDLQLIRFSTYEILYKKEASAVSINEAVELAKKYSDLDDGKASAFVNSVLDKIRLKLEELSEDDE